MASPALLPLAPGTRELLCLQVPLNILAALRDAGFKVVVGNLAGTHPVGTHDNISRARIILVDVTVGGQDTIGAVRRLRSTQCLAASASRTLCFSTARRNLHFAMELGKWGARYVRVSDMTILTEAIELLSAEMSDLERTGPCFHLVHSFSRGMCSPGEMIGAIELCHEATLFQLRLGLSQRFIFNLLAENRAIALDAFQIAAGLSNRFYREHALNSGMRQTTKVRVATVKVLMGRIRQAMSEAFREAGLNCDPYEVLRTFTTEGSNRALYRLHANFRWSHTP